MSDWLVWLFFESTVALASVLLLVCFTFLALWRRGGRPQPLLFALGASAGLLILQAVIVTPRERAVAVLTPIEQDFRAGRATALAEALSPDFFAGEMGRAEFLGYVAEALSRTRITWITRLRIEIESAAAGAFTARVNYLADVVVSESAGAFRSRWRIHFERRDGVWRIREIEPLFVDGVPNPRWERLRRW